MRTYACLSRSLALFICFGSLSSLSAQEIQWRYDYSAALKEAESKKIPLMVDFYTSNCSWCQKLDYGTFRDPAVVKMLNERFVPLKVDAHQHRWLANALGIHRYPSMVFASWDSTLLHTQEGFMDSTSLLHRLIHSLSDNQAKPVALAADTSR